MKHSVRNVYLLALMFLAALATSALAQEAQPSDPEVAGAWQGEIETPGTPLGVEVEFQSANGEWQGEIDIPAQGAVDIPLGSISVEGDQVSFAIAGVPGNPTFDGELADGRIEGTFTQGGQQIPFMLSRADDGTDAEAAEGTEPTDGPEAADDAGEADDTGTADGGEAAEQPVAPGPGPADPAAGDPAAQPGQAEVYEDPAGRYTVPVPTGWSVEEQDEYARLTSPEGGIDVYMTVVETDEIASGVETGWERVRPEFDLEVDMTQEQPAPAGIERVEVFNYGTGDPDQIVQAVGLRHEGLVYVLLFDAETEAAQRRASQLNIVNTGFDITAVEEVELTDQEPRELSDQQFTQLAEYVEGAMERFGIPGATVSVVQGGEIVYAEGFGVRGGERDESVDPSTLMMIGSTTKTMTTMLMGALVDEGALEWDTPVQDVLPGFEVADEELSEQITVQNLVCACTGVPRRDFELLFNADDLDAEAIVESLADFEVFTDFGEAFQYSNQMVAAGGYAATAAAGQEYGELQEGYPEVMREYILGPVGMAYSTFSFDEVFAHDDFAVPHGFTPEGGYEPVSLEYEEFVLPVAPAGALWSNSIDMGRYLIALMNRGVAADGLRVISEENLEHTWQAQVPVSAEASYGLGWFVDEYKGLRLLHHGGNTLGFTSDLAFLPAEGLGVSVLTNAASSTYFNAAVRQRVFELAYDLEPESDEQATLNYQAVQQMIQDLAGGLEESIDQEAASPYEGRYSNQGLGQIELYIEEGELFFDAGEFTSELLPVSEDETDAAADTEGDAYAMVDGPLLGSQVRLQMSESGEPNVVFGQGVTEYRFEPVD